jgi:hypothetical protein
VDLLNNAYPEAYQAAFRARAVARLPTADAVAEGDGPPQPPGALPHALVMHPPLATAAGWHVQARALGSRLELGLFFTQARRAAPGRALT